MDGHPLLAHLEPAPGDIALVLTREQHVPFGHWAPHAAIAALAARLEAYFAHRAAKGIGAGIDGVGQDVVDRVVERQPPGDAALLRRLVTCDGQTDASRNHTCTCRTLCNSVNLAKTRLRASCTR